MDPRDASSLRIFILSILSPDSSKEYKPKDVNLPHTMKLKDPFSLGKKNYEEVVFSNMLVEMYTEGIGNESTISDYLDAVACMIGFTKTETAELSFRDFMRCMEIVSPFLPNGLEMVTFAE
jgi:hypothetical protein